MPHSPTISMAEPSSERFKRELVSSLPRARRLALGLTGSHEAADELLQRACERALSRWQQWVPGTHLDRWLFSIVSSIWKNELRSDAIRRGTGFVDASSYLLTEDRIEQRTDAAAAVRALFGLPEAQRVALILVYMEGYTYKEAAELEGVAVGTIMSRLARGRMHLAEQFRGRSKAATVSLESTKDGN